MRKLIWLFIVLLIMPGVVLAEVVNLTKPGTSWVWKVENGLDASGGFALTEAGANIVTEAGARLGLEQKEYWYLFLESGDRFLTEKDEVLLTDAFSAENYSALYLQLIGQGWTRTEDAATVPQGIDGSGEASSLRFALVEDGTFLTMENTNNLRLEN